MQKKRVDSAQSFIEIKGARVNNLKNIDVNIPKNRLVVITGLSGSGKSSLAFDTLYAEGQRRYVESLSSDAQARGRLHQRYCTGYSHRTKSNHEQPALYCRDLHGDI